MVHNQTNMNRNGNNHLTCRPTTVLLDNSSMVHDSNKLGNDHTGNPSVIAREWFHGLMNQNGKHKQATMQRGRERYEINRAAEILQQRA